MNVLIIEDMVSIATLFGRYIKPLASDIQFARTMKEAHSRIKEQHDKGEIFDLISLDLGLPDSKTENTIEEIAQLKTMCPDAMVVVLTGQCGIEPAKVIEKGADGFISKLDVAKDGKNYLDVLRTIATGIVKEPKKRYSRNVEVLEKFLDELSNHYSKLPT